MKREYKILLIILFVGLCLRILFLVQFHSTPFYRQPTLDALYYDQLAKSVSRGKIIQDDAFFMGPLYPYGLGFVYFVTGGNALVPRILQALLGLGCCGLIFHIGRRLFNSGTGLLGAGFYAVYKPALFYEQTLLSETPMAFMCLFFWAFFLWSHDKRIKFRVLWVGIIFGISALFRGNVLLFAPILALWFFLEEYKKSERKFSLNILKPVAFLTIGVILGILPATIHNLVAEKDFVLITSNGGFNFFIGNNKKANGFFDIPARVDMDQDPSGRRVAEAVTGRSPMKSSDVSEYWSGKAWKFIRENPGPFLRITAKKAYYFWSGSEIAQIYSMKYIRSFMPALGWPLLSFVFLGPFCLVGIFMGFFKKNTYAQLLILFIITYGISLLPFFITARYRIPVIPFCCIFAAYGVTRLIHYMREKKWREAVSIMAAILFLIIIFNLRGQALNKEAAAQFHNTLGLIYGKEGEPEKAAEHFRKSIAAVPSSYSYANLANISMHQGKYKSAMKRFQNALGLEPDNARIHFNIAQAYGSSGKLEESLEHYRIAVKLDRRVHHDAWYNMALIYARKGQKKEFQEAAENYMAMRPEDQKSKMLFKNILNDGIHLHVVK